MTETIRIERSKSGIPALWEQGGSATNTGDATIIAGQDGQAKRPLYIRKRGHLSCSRHALIPLAIGDHIIEADHHRKDFDIKIYKVLSFGNTEEEAYAVIEQVNHFNKGEWDKDLPTYLQAAVEAAKDKATCYHCRSPHFIIED